jgi:phosphoglycerol transferase
MALPAKVMPVRDTCTALLLYFLTATIALAAACVVMKVWGADLTVPFSYGHDSFIFLTWIKGVLDNGWWLTNPYLGSPLPAEMHDFPQNASLHFLVVKCLGWVRPDAGFVCNVYFLASFPLAAVTALAALRAMRMSAGPAVAGSILYAFVPYHFWRGENHLFLSTYYLIPLLGLVIIWLARGEAFLVVRRPTGRIGLELKSPRALGSLAICCALGFDFPYYSLFAAFFLLLAGVSLFCLGRQICLLGRSALLLAVLCVSFLVNLSPHLLYRYRHGPNPAPDHVTRHPWLDGEIQGLKVVQLLIPAADHRLPSFKKVRDRYYSGTPLVSEGDAMALGTTGSVGFVFLVVCLVWCQRSATERGQLYFLFGLLIVFAVLVASVGGFGTFFNLIYMRITRTYNRISIFIAFFALAGAFGAIDDLCQRVGGLGKGAVLAAILAPCMLMAGLWDQTSKTYLEPFALVQQEFASDAAFVAQIEAAVPEQTMVFQFPFLSYCSYTNTSHIMMPYDHFRGYLHSRKLHWSFGAMHGRSGDELQAGIAKRPLPECVRLLAEAGFGGIYVDRNGYADHGAGIEATLAALLGRPPLVSPNQRLCFFNIGHSSQAPTQTGSDKE